MKNSKITASLRLLAAFLFINQLHLVDSQCAAPWTGTNCEICKQF